MKTSARISDFILLILLICHQWQTCSASKDLTYFHEDQNTLDHNVKVILLRKVRAAVNGSIPTQTLTTISTPSTSKITTSTPNTSPTTPTTTPSTKFTTDSFLPPDVTAPVGTNEKTDFHNYYVSYVKSERDEYTTYWYELADDTNHVRHSQLSDAHRVAITVGLKFDFPFYGHNVRKVTIATGGFVYVSDFIHQWLTATQYIAPLMANFNTKLGVDSAIYYLSEGNRFIVQWQQVHVVEHEQNGPFTFQLHMLDDGTIYFIYKQIPLPLLSISTSSHPVKCGTSDAYYYDKIMGSIRRRTIYEYHRVEIDKVTIKSYSVVTIRPLPTCNRYGDCLGCSGAKIGFKCQWCQATKKCSDGMDRHRQLWIDNKCSQRPTGPICPAGSQKPNVIGQQSPKTESSKSAGATVGIVLAVIAAILLFGGVAVFVWYAYRNPTTKPGQWLIKHRPNNWKVTFFKRNTTTGDKYRVDSNTESTA